MVVVALIVAVVVKLYYVLCTVGRAVLVAEVVIDGAISRGSCQSLTLVSLISIEGRHLYINVFT